MIIFSYITFISLFLVNVFPQNLNFNYESFPFFTIIIVVICILYKTNFVLENLRIFFSKNKTILHILILYFFFSILSFFLYFNIFQILRILMPLLIGAISYIIINNLQSFQKIKIIKNILIFYLFLFILQKNYLPFFSAIDFCTYFKEIISRGICAGINAPTFLSPEPSYHAFYLIFLVIYSENIFKKLSKKFNIIRTLLLLNLYISTSTLSFVFLFIYIFYLIYSFKKNWIYYYLFFIFLGTALFTFNNSLENLIRTQKFVTTLVRMEYNILTIKEITIIPKKNLEEIPNIFKAKVESDIIYYKKILNLPHIWEDYLNENSNIQPTSSILYTFYIFGFVFSIIFFYVFFKLINLKIKNKNSRGLIIIMYIPYLIINIFLQSFFANIGFWVLTLEVLKNDKKN